MDRRTFLAGTAAGAGLAPAILVPAARAQGAQPFKGQTVSALLEGHPTSTAIERMLPAFEAETGIKVTLEIVPESDITAKTLLAFSSGSGRYDVVEDNAIFAVGFARSNYIVPLDDLARSLPASYDPADFVPGYLKAMRIDAKLYGLPVYGESTFLMYRKDLLEQQGLKVPTTFDELRATAIAIKEQGGGRTAGITLRGQQGIQNVYIWAAFLWGYGGRWLDGGRAAVASPEAQAGLAAYADLLNAAGPVGVANFGWEENRLLFQQGRAAMTIDATVNGAYNEDPVESAVAGLVGYAPVPRQPVAAKGSSASLAVHGFYVGADSKAKEAAWTFASWATAKAQQVKSLETDPNSGVTSLAAMNSPVFLEKYGAFKDAMLRAIADGNIDYLPSVPQANAMIDAAGIAVSKALAGTASPAEALAEAQAAMDRALAN